MAIKPVFVSTYPPRECGIATFTQDLVNAIEKYNDVRRCYIIALSKDKHIYDNRVLYDINQDKFSNYVKAANLINMSDIDVVVIEHEYGIFGGEDGDYIIPFVKLIKKTNHYNIPHSFEKPNCKTIWDTEKVGRCKFQGHNNG